MDPLYTRLQSLERAVAALPADLRPGLERRIARMRQRLETQQPIDRSLAAFERDLLNAQRGKPASPRTTQKPARTPKRKRSPAAPRRPNPERIARRAAAIPKLTWPDLPVCARRSDLLQTIREHPVTIVCGDTGSGKTTQLPKILLELGHGVHGTIGCTQPRRLAAVSVARRVAEELDVKLGGPVGYQVRFDAKAGPDTLVKFMTDGILLAETQADASLSHYDALIIDEAHERSLNIDFLLGYLQDLRLRRPDLKLVISSATLDAEAFSDFFGGAPVVTVEGRMFPITDEYLPATHEDESLHQHVARGVELASELAPEGDILVFLPGEREIRLATDLLQGRRLPKTDVLPLYARLGLKEQQKVFAPSSGRRRIVLATNVAETSLTIPGIRVVIDSGVARITGFNPRTQVQSLQVRPVSQASARQRRGRCGRVGPGLCIRLYEEEDLEERSAYTPPEIRRSSLAGVILRMKTLGLPDIQRFPFVDPPPNSLVKDGLRTLAEIGAVDKHRELTPLGRDLARFPVDPRIARIIAAGHEGGVIREVLVLAAGLSVPNPRERPHERLEDADAAHAEWKDERSDFIGLLKVWNHLATLPTKSALRRECRRRFLSARRVLEWQNILRELTEQVKQVYGKLPREAQAEAATYHALHRALLAGLPSNIGTRDVEAAAEKDEPSRGGRKRGSTKAYRGARERTFHLHPGSGLFEEPPEWVVAFSLVETSKLYARQAGEIDPAWLEDIAPHLCTFRYADPAWDERRGVVNARETVACCGLQIVPGRPADYGKQRPAEARAIFIRQALVPGRLGPHAERADWLQHHLAQRKTILELEQKLRRPNGLLDEDGLVTFFDERLPEHVVSTATFEAWRKAESPDLTVPWETATYEHRDSFPLEALSTHLPAETHGCALTYHCAPGESEDGITLHCNLAQLESLPPWAGEWLVPGWLTEKIALLLKTLPKQSRHPLHPIAKTAAEFVEQATPDGPLLPTLCRHLRSTFGMHVTPEDFDSTRVPEHLRMRFCVRDPAGKPIAISRDLETARSAVSGERVAAVRQLTPPEFHRSGETSWGFGVLPPSIPLDQGFEGFPALVDEGGKSVGLRVFPERAEAEARHRRGVARLLRLTLPARFAHAREYHGLPTRTALSLSVLGPEPRHNLDDLLDRAALTLAAQSSLTSQGAQTELPRNARAFLAASERVREGLHDCLHAHASLLDRITAGYDAASAVLETLRGDARCPASVADIDQQIHQLFRARFLRDATDLDEYPRYLKALGIRLERLARAPAKDEEKMKRTAPYLDLPDALQPLLQEFRIAVFAPELGTRLKVSEAILDRARTGDEGPAPQPVAPAPIDTSSLADDLAKAWGRKE